MCPDVKLIWLGSARLAAENVRQTQITLASLRLETSFHVHSLCVLEALALQAGGSGGNRFASLLAFVSPLMGCRI